MKKTYDNSFAKLSLCTDVKDAFPLSRSSKAGYYSLIWVSNGMLDLLVDEVLVSIDAKQMIFITPIEYVKIVEDHGDVKVIQFNREFYCIKENDHEVSCDGILYFGSKGVPIINLNDREFQNFDRLLGVLEDEFEVVDTIQEEMLRIVLKKMLIKSTRILKEQNNYVGENEPKMELLRQFRILLEKNYRKFHKVKDYASFLNKSPKTISNQFKILGLQKPSKMIQERIIVEAKRYLLHSQLSIKEIAFKLGFDDATSFSHYFKSFTEISPTQFKEIYHKV